MNQIAQGFPTWDAFSYLQDTFIVNLQQINFRHKIVIKMEKLHLLFIGFLMLYSDFL